MTRHLLNTADLRLAARSRLPRMLFEFVDRGAEDEIALENNISRIRDIKLKQRPLVDVAERSLRCSVLGQDLDMPVIISPTGIAGLLWHDGEMALARAARDAGVPYCLATTSVSAMEEVADKVGGRLWYQLYIWPDMEMTLSMVRRARAAAFETLVVTVDSGVPPNREYNTRNSYAAPFRFNAQNVTDVMLHPRWMLGTLGRYMLGGGMPKFKNYPPELMAGILSRKIERKSLNNPRQTWEDIRRLRDEWPGKLVIKGLMLPEDVRRAAEIGADGVSISNHGGRTLDASPAPIEMLAGAVEAAQGRIDILIDGGFRRGTDVIKALALGAKAVLVGRGILFGVAAAGESGARTALEIYRSEISRTLAYLGCTSVADLSVDHLFDRNRN